MSARAQASGAAARGAGIWFTLLTALLALTGCPNMEEQSSYRPYEPSIHFQDRTSARPVPRFTVARDAVLDQPVLFSGRAGGALATQFPLPVTRELLRRGQERFSIYCAVCHGADGHGSGIIVRRGFPPPPSFHDERLRREPLGHFFEVITHGYGVMYSYADRVTPRDRWAIIAYIRALQRSQHATLADVPAAERDALRAAPP
jgi:mono/diheme cytochrome c family protein